MAYEDRLSAKQDEHDRIKERENIKLSITTPLTTFSNLSFFLKLAVIFAYMYGIITFLYIFYIILLVMFS